MVDSSTASIGQVEQVKKLTRNRTMREKQAVLNFAAYWRNAANPAVRQDLSLRGRVDMQWTSY
jgi:hypothetical protein